MDYRVRVERNKLKFAAAHFATFTGQCEPLHGHNYAVAIEVAGALTDDSWVVDFSTLKTLGKALCDELDHKFILQRDSRVLQIDEGMSNWKVRFLERGFVFPKADVIALPIDNTTAERLAEWFVDRLKTDLAAKGATNLTQITVMVEEAPGQSATATTSP
ncbi:MAG TPA: 6-pyruvoyl tetrahydropterin synthase family protein [Dehalococcoidia bacterium]|jgi:6-pyruvoyltetrahydropterin/6-carboxytetrahydropterin synthase|nr:6-pyruvoyl tetrahydropterin synthase family protein [Dehalococcoidia bacterium]